MISKKLLKVYFPIMDLSTSSCLWVEVTLGSGMEQMTALNGDTGLQHRYYNQLGGMPIFISASAILAYRHFFSISAYRHILNNQAQVLAKRIVSFGAYCHSLVPMIYCHIDLSRMTLCKVLQWRHILHFSVL